MRRRLAAAALALALTCAGCMPWVTVGPTTAPTPSVGRVAVGKVAVGATPSAVLAPPTTAPTVGVSPIPSAVATSAAAPAPDPRLTYTQPDYGFSFRYDPSWSLAQAVGADMRAQGGLYYADSIKLVRGTTVVVIAYRLRSQSRAMDSLNSAGDLLGRGEVRFIGQMMPRTVLMYEGKDKAVYYHAERGPAAEPLVFDVALLDLSANYLNVSLPAALQAEVDAIVASFALGETATPTAAVGSPTGATTAIPVDGLDGVVERAAPGGAYDDRLVSADGQIYGLYVADSALATRLATAAWLAKPVRLSGLLRQPMQDAGGRQIVVQGLEELPSAAATPSVWRDLSPYATPGASSQLPSDRLGSYSPWSAVDGRLETAWTEGAAGDGTGEWLTLTFPGMARLHAVQIATGFQWNATTFANNNRPRTLTAILDGGRTLTLNLQDARGWQSFDLGDVESASLKLVIVDVFKGVRYDDACISEVQVLGLPE